VFSHKAGLVLASLTATSVETVSRQNDCLGCAVKQGSLWGGENAIAKKEERNLHGKKVGGSFP